MCLLHLQDQAQLAAYWEMPRRIGLNNLTFDRPTAGDGNCFYRAIIQQLQRPEILQHMPTHLRFQDHDVLRVAVVNFVRENCNCEIFQNYREAYKVTHSNLTFDQILNRQQQSSTYAHELFIHATAFMLNLPILVTSEKNTAVKPYQLIRCSAGEADDASTEILQMLTNEQDGTSFFLRIGSIDSNHFQSLILSNTVATTNTTLTSPTINLPTTSASSMSNNKQFASKELHLKKKV